ncbi:hypothetical protein EVJ58_g10982 [Rhodofomes roseus]|uniref:Uncharacterized protein n=1 Tax=Rhodofomes roseus TaxID=34475 RepID=A0A4Y9XLK4_9APHY|nr:hypothetical protein EVJ58_g10982 [Rhodofomes roseus]
MPAPRRHRRIQSGDLIDLTEDIHDVSGADVAGPSNVVAPSRSSPVQPSRKPQLVYIWAYVVDGAPPENFSFDTKARTSFVSIFTSQGLRLTDQIGVWLSCRREWQYMFVDTVGDLLFYLHEGEILVWSTWGLQELQMLSGITGSSTIDVPKWPSQKSLWRAREAMAGHYNHLRLSGELNMTMTMTSEVSS